MSKRTVLAILIVVVLRTSFRVIGKLSPAIVGWCIAHRYWALLALPVTWANTSLKPSTRIDLTPLGWRVVGHHRTVGPGRVVYVLHRLRGADGQERTFAQVMLALTSLEDPTGSSKERETTSP